MHKIKREIGIVMLARARYARGEILAIFVKSVKTLKSGEKFGDFVKSVKKHSKATRRQKSSKWSKALELLAEANISQK